MPAAGEVRRAVGVAAAGRMLAALAAVSALLALAGWWLGQPALASAVPGHPAASPVAAAAILVAAAAVSLPEPSVRLVRAAGGTALLASAASLLRPWAPATPAEAAGLLLLGAGLLATGRHSGAARAGRAVLAILAATAYGLLLDALWPGAAVALLPVPSAVGLAAVSGAALLLAPGGTPLARLLARDDIGGRLARWTFPASLLGLPALAFLQLRAAAAGLAPAPTLPRAVVGSAVLVAALAWAAAAIASRAEAQRVAVESRHQAVVDSAAEAILTFRPDGAVVLANRSAEALFQRNREALLGAPVWPLFAAKDRGRLQDGTASFLAHGDRGLVGRTVQVHALRPGGEEVPAEVSIGQWTSAEGPFFTAIVRDVSRRQTIEEALRAARRDAEAAARAKSDFLANMSHEIRTPMNAVIGMTGLLLQTRLDAEQKEFATTIRNSGEHLMTVINDILDFSKIEAGKLELERIPVDVRALVEDAVDIVAHRAREKGLEVGALVEPEVPAAIHGDPARLRQVLLNLLSNAVKFTHDGHVVVRVAAMRQAAGPWQLQFRVEDTGIGIAPEAAGRLFQMFSQVDSSTTRAYGGTGLGLAISKRLTELMGGTIGVESTPGKGSTFHVTIPVEEAPVPARPATAPDPASLAGRRVLVVDDGATNRRVFRLQCEAWGMRVEEAADGEAAARRLEQGERFDLILLDHEMPALDGPRAAARLRRADPATAIVVATSVGDVAVAYPPDLRVAAILTKPVRQAQLLECITHVLAPRADRPGASGPSPTGRAKGLRILIAEDNPVNQKVAFRMLEKLGYQATVAGDGEEAVAAASKALDAGAPFQLVLMDVQMPRMDGLEATRRIRALAGPAVRIVAMTADVMPGDRERCLQAGMDDFLPKPVRLEALSALLGQVEARQA
jgi:two-component system, sensor histidine kinase and response regulator